MPENQVDKKQAAGRQVGEKQQQDVGTIEGVKDKLAKPTPQNLANVPDYIKPSAAGLEEMDREDITLPRIAIAQANSPAVKKSDDRFIPGLTEGQLYNTVTRENYGDSIEVTALFFFKNRILFGPYGSGEGILCQSFNGIDGGRLSPLCADCPHSKFKKKADAQNGDTRPDCNRLMNYMCLLSDGTWAALCTKSTDLAAAQQLNAIVRMSRLPMYAKKLKVSTISKKRKDNSFYGFVLKWEDFAPKDLYQAAEAAFSELRGKGVKVDTSGLEHEREDETGFDTNQM